MEVHPYIFGGADFSEKLFKDWCLLNPQPTILFLTYFYKIAILSKGCKPDNVESQNSLKLSFTNIRGFCSNFAECQSFLEANSWHSCSMWDKLGWLNMFWQFLCQKVSSLNPKRFCHWYVWSCSLCEGRTSICKGLISRKLCVLLLMFSTGFTLFSILLLFSLSTTFFVLMQGF